MYSNIIKTFKTRIKYEHKLFFEKEKIFIILILDEKFLEITFPKKYLISETPIILFLWIIFSSIILSLISFLFMRIQVRAISRLAKFSEDFGSGVDSKNFKPEGALEVRQAGNAFLKSKCVKEAIRRSLKGTLTGTGRKLLKARAMLYIVVIHRCDTRILCDTQM